MSSSPKSRRYSRIALRKGIRVGWQVKGERNVAYATTFGLGGLFIATRQPCAVGEILKLLIDLPEGEVRAVATVRDCRPQEGMGVEFITMSAEDRVRMQQLLKKIECLSVGAAS
jgi:hypothetical protein